MGGPVIMLAALLLLGGCATTAPEGQSFLTTKDREAIEARLHRDELAILAINTKLEGIKKLATGPGPAITPSWNKPGSQALPVLAPPPAPAMPVPEPASTPLNAAPGKVVFKADADKLRRMKAPGQKREVLSLMSAVRDLPANGKYIVMTPAKYQEDEYLAGEVKFNLMKALVEAGRTSWANVRDETYGGRDVVVYAAS